MNWNLKGLQWPGGKRTETPEAPKPSIADFEAKEGEERGSTKVVVKFIRHGERSKDEELLDLGRKITRQRAQESGLIDEQFDFVQAVGSPSGASEARNYHAGGDHYARSTETPNIYAHVISPSPLPTRTDERLGYETMKYDHTKIYDHKGIWNAGKAEYIASLGKTEETLSDDEKVAAAKFAQRSVTQHLLSLTSPDAMGYKREAAGALASFLNEYRGKATKLRKGTKGLVVAGTHGGTMEFLLQQATVTEKDGERVVGLSSLDDIGGEFSPSEAYTVAIETDAEGREKEIIVTFDNPDRPQKEFRLDAAKVDELAEFYEELHANDASHEA